MSSLIPGESTWLVWAAVLCITAFAFISEQKWKWAQIVSSAIVGIFGAMILANLRVIPTKSPVYSTIGAYILPLSIPLLLFKCDIRKIIKESGNLFLIMNVAIAASCLSGLLCKYMFKNTPGMESITGMLVGAYTGGTVNLVAMGKVFQAGDTFVAAGAVVVNIFVIFILLLYSFMAYSRWFRKQYRHPHIDAFESKTQVDTNTSAAAQHWKPKPISLRDIILTLATGMAIAAISHFISEQITLRLPGLIDKFIAERTVTGDSVERIAAFIKDTVPFAFNIYLIIPTLTLLLVAFFPKYFNKLAGAEEMGNIMIMLFFVVVGCGADIRILLKVGPVFIISAVIILTCNLGVLLGLGKLFKWSLEDIITCSNASIGGPTTAAAIAVNKGWTALVAPGLLVGLYGYAIGNYCGVLIGKLL